jgi:hypothetical protein
MCIPRLDYVIFCKERQGTKIFYTFWAPFLVPQIGGGKELRLIVKITKLSPPIKQPPNRARTSSIHIAPTWLKKSTDITQVTTSRQYDRKQHR